MGKVVVEQARDPAALGAIIADAQFDACRIGASGALLLVAWRDNEPVGIAEMICRVDAALLNVLWVVPAMRGSGIGAALLGAVRKAARVRGARRLYAFADSEWLGRSGFTPADQQIARGDEVWLSGIQRQMPSDRFRGFRMLDISRDGIVER